MKINCLDAKNYHRDAITNHQAAIYNRRDANSAMTEYWIIWTLWPFDPFYNVYVSIGMPLLTVGMQIALWKKKKEKKEPYRDFRADCDTNSVDMVSNWHPFPSF